MANKTFINSIELDWATEYLDNLSFDVTDQNVQSSDFSNITTHVREVSQPFSITAVLNNEDRQDKFERIKLLAKERGLVTFRQDNEVKDLVITSLAETGKFDNMIRFEISFKPVRLVEFETVEAPKPLRKPKLRKPKTRGKQQVSQNNISSEDKIEDEKGKTYKVPKNLSGGVGGRIWSI